MVLKELCALRGVSGDEKRVREFIRERVERFADKVTIDRIGNLYAFKKGTGENRKHIALVAHMDEVGLIVKGVNDNGLISYRTVGSIDPRVVISKPVRIGDQEVPGVIGAKAIHLQSAEDRKHMLPHDQLYIDIGARDKESAEKLVEAGDYITFESKWVEFGDGLVKARALDDRIGCMVLMSILEGDYPCDITCIFTVQEEIGLRGAEAAAFNVESDAAIVLEGEIANDLGDVEEHKKVAALHSGVVISPMDRASIPSAKLYARLREIAIGQEIPWQLKRYVAGSTDAGPFQQVRGARAVCVLGTPCRYVHSPSCVAAFEDIEAQFRLVEAFLDEGGAF